MSLPLRGCERNVIDVRAMPNIGSMVGMIVGGKVGAGVNVIVGSSVLVGLAVGCGEGVSVGARVGVGAAKLSPPQPANNEMMNKTAKSRSSFKRCFLESYGLFFTTM